MKDKAVLFVSYLEYALGYTIQSVTSTRCQSGWRSYPNCIGELFL